MSIFTNGWSIRLWVLYLVAAWITLAGPGRAVDGGQPLAAEAGGPPAPADELWQQLAPLFQPPDELADDLGDYRSPLVFDDGTPVRTADQWPRRRQEILDAWHGLMGPWPEEIERPAVEYLDETRRDGLTQHSIRIEVARDDRQSPPTQVTRDAYLLVPDGEGPFPAVLVVYYDAASGAGLGAELRDFGYQLARRGFVALSLGSDPESYFPDKQNARLQPLSFHAYVAANCANALGNLPYVDAQRIGIVGHSYGGKWAMFAACLSEKFAATAWSDPGIVFDESRGNVNYWEPWYLGYEPGRERERGIPTADNPRTGPYRHMIETGRDLHELHALMAPRPLFVSGGSEDPPERWRALNHSRAVNRLLGYDHRVAMANRPGHAPTPASNAQIDAFFEYFLR